MYGSTIYSSYVLSFDDDSSVPESDGWEKIELSSIRSELDGWTPYYNEENRNSTIVVCMQNKYTIHTLIGDESNPLIFIW